MDRVASSLANPAHLYTLYILLFSMPGVPSIYYGSEWGIEGKKSNGSDLPLRPRLDLDQLARQAPQPDLPKILVRLARLRQASQALQTGSYCQLFVGPQQMAFIREAGSERVIVALNCAEKPARIELKLPPGCGSLVDLLNPPARFAAQKETCVLDVAPNWARILQCVS